MGRRGQTAQGGHQVILALLLTVSIMLVAPASGQTPAPEAPNSADLVDPDCPRDTDPPADPALAEDSPAAEDAALVEEPDGVCPPDEGSDPPGDGPNPPGDGSNPPGDGPSPPGDGPGPPPDGPDAGPGPSSPDVNPPPDAPAGAPQGQPESPVVPGVPVSPRQPDGGDRSDPRKKDARVRQRDRDESSGGAYAEPRDVLRPKRRHAGSRRNSSTALDDAKLPDLLPGLSNFGGVPDFVARGSSVPRYLRGIYQAAEARYGIRWEVLAAINEIETYYGRNLNISSAGAVGWMQFMPGTWRAYGTDANGDGVKDPYDPEDAIFSAARYLKASGYADDVRGALFAYNHAGWYVEDVLERARRIAAENVSLPVARRLDQEFATRLARVAARAGIRWELTLAVLRVRGMDGAVPATRAELRKLVRRLVRLGARTDPRGALRRLAKAELSGAALGPRLLRREPTFVERVIALTHYNRAVGREGLVRGLGAVKEELTRRVLASNRLAIYPGGRADIAKGVTDVHVLLLLSYLSSRYHEVTVTSLTTGHSLLTASGNVSAHSYGRAVDIAALNGTSILGHQEPGGPTELLLRRILLLPAELEPKQLISLFALGGPSFALEDHADHVHAGY
jgi:hypothetical protein